MNPRHHDKILIVCGPTASGKSGLAMALARELNGEIINADSRQIYGEFHIGVDKPKKADLDEIPHHLYDAGTIGAPWNAARYIEAADEAIRGVRNRQRLPIVVGGTGLYLKSLLFGLFEGEPIPQEIRLKLNERLKDEGLGVLYEELKMKDPEAAGRIHANDPVRVLRALEIHESTGRPISEWQKRHGFEKSRYRFRKIALSWPREMLYERINQRVGHMRDAGLIDEARSLYERFGPQNEVFLKTIGYAEWIPFFKGEQTEAQVLDLIRQNTRNLAKRQLTWFKRETDLDWIEGGPQAEAKILKSLENFID